MKILAIDPGTSQSGYALWNGTQVGARGVEENGSMLDTICANFLAVDVLAVEQIGHYGLGMAAGKEVFDTCLWIGRFIQRWKDLQAERYGGDEGKPVHLVLRPSIKTHLCGTPRAKDANVRQSIIDRLGAPGTKKAPGVIYGVTSHSMQALALALYVGDMLRCGFELPRAA